MALHGIAGEREGGHEVFARVFVLRALKLKLAERGEVEGVPGEAFRVGDRSYRFQPVLWARALANVDGPVERYNR